MKVILLDKVKNLGIAGTEVNVKSGYARNFLIPSAKAMLATEENVLFFKSHRIFSESNANKMRLEAECKISKIQNIGSVTITSKSSILGKLFGSIGTREIADAVTKSGVQISKNNVFLPDGKIRALGDYDVVIKFYRKISTILHIHVINQS
ncbi:50S ribosomal protein L9 [Blochmannia endosymbiont of Polyrhachis (Hedomyrma) turneri]|uniref:50S ribosomal protein L9 n=1 Tax=Blochmannia endosymbiont of Polyrhachis (Hedomyrma) turneri TaxID=1505596 RepID=UPI00061A6EEF|nr:50S ribosomal protein L9 [Blochmannia endosymbiont of Polyrhachis (Hedomyrma) turneri]AKC59673.1 50S ribosomal protein L9 [Blochmannia endosymbiont of Polyrhachis (Hedomyrma) turneri]